MQNHIQLSVLVSISLTHTYAHRKYRYTHTHLISIGCVKSYVCSHMCVCAQVEWGGAQAGAVGPGAGAERGWGVHPRGGGARQRRPHWGHLPAPTGTNDLHSLTLDQSDCFTQGESLLMVVNPVYVQCLAPVKGFNRCKDVLITS